MSTKKKKAPAAQNLIDSLLDEKTPKASKPSASAFSEQPEPTTYHISDEGLSDAEPLADFSVFVSDTFRGEHPHKNASRDGSEKGESAFKFGSGPKVIDPGTLSGKHDFALHSGSNEPSGDDSTQVVPLQKKKAQTSTVEVPGGTTLKNEIPSGEPVEGQSLDRWSPTEVKTVVRPQKEDFAKATSPGPVTSAVLSAEAALKQSESLRIAQTRISGLEHELERLRRENEQLTTAGETLRRRSDELLSKTESLEIQSRESARMFEEEKKVFRGQIQQKERENHELRVRLEEMESRLEGNFKKIRVRERELEHRLEIIKMESATLVSTKDKMILDLKRQIDQLAHENEYAKQKTQELFKQYKEKQETIRRVVRALRIALTVLEGDEDAAPLKKAE